MRKNFLKDQIDIVKGFQYSVNIGFDINNDEKIKGLIPTTASLEVIEDILLSTHVSSSDRARILIGAYGKGKSHIVLVLLSLLLKKDIRLFENLLPKIKELSPELYDYAINYIKSNRKLLPIIIQGSSLSLTQSLLGALQKALENQGFEDLLPETHFQAALDVINTWEVKYPETFKRFAKSLREQIDDFKLRLSEYDVEAYDEFVELYPSLTSGSLFNPFLGFDVVDLYTKVIEKLQSKGYQGVFVVYDEFSKFLEAGIAKISSVDIKLLQDFAEKCNRSKDKQMHLLLISHKDISNYIDKLPKQKVDGWKGVSERFKHVEVRNNFSQIYEIIATVIKKNPDYFVQFFNQHKDKFKDVSGWLSENNIFSELTDEQLETVTCGCYPLHPISTFILPRLSEKVAQNERTLFTFLSSENKNTLFAFLQNSNDVFPVLTPEYIYDYFEPLFKKEVYTSETHKIYLLTTNILAKLNSNSLGSKIIKTIALIYITGQFEKLPPTPEVIINVFRDTVTDISEITTVLKELQDRQYVIYMKKSNNHLKLKNSISIDIGKRIADCIEQVKGIYRVKDILNSFSYDNYMFPTSYNDDNEITRYFNFSFIDGEEFLGVENWDKKIEAVEADGVLYGIVPKDSEENQKILNMLRIGIAANDRIIFVISSSDSDIEKIVFEYQAVKNLKDQSVDDDALVEEYNIYIEDLEEVIEQYISSYTKPEARKSTYYHKGEKQQIFRKSHLSQLLSKICSNIYTDSPIINNESINKDFLPTIAINSRSKVITGLLANQLEHNLGLTGTGQDIFIMRSTLIMTGILVEAETNPRLILSGNPNLKIQNVIDEIIAFLRGTNNNCAVSFKELYDRLIRPEYHIGLKKGVIPIFIAVVLHSFKQYIVITRNNKELEINAELLNSINDNPSEYSVCLENWNEEKSEYISKLEQLFEDHIVDKEKEYNTFAYIVRAMQRWFIGLPKYAKELNQIYESGKFKKIDSQKQKFISSLKVSEINAREFLFVKMFTIFKFSTITPNVVDNISAVKILLDNAKDNLVKSLITDVRSIFNYRHTEQASLNSVIKDWFESLSETTQNHLYNGGEERILNLIRTMTNDEKLFIERLAKALTGLRVDDWDEKTIHVFLEEVKSFKETIENKDKEVDSSASIDNEVYKISFTDETGIERTKTFNKMNYSDKAKLMFNEIATILDDYARALSENEKRQVLLELIKDLC